MKLLLQIFSIILVIFFIVQCSSPNEGETPANHPPIAYAGKNQIAAVNHPVQLHGSATDADGDAVSYSWRQIQGTPVQLSAANIANPGLTTPAAPDTLGFELRVSDGKAPGDPDTVYILVVRNTTSDYFPLEVGNLWRYKVREKTGTIVLGVPVITSAIPITGEATLTVTGIRQVNGVNVYQVQFQEQSATDSSDQMSIAKKLNHSLELVSANEAIFRYDSTNASLQLVFSPTNPSPSDSVFSGFSLALNTTIDNIHYSPADTLLILFEEDPNPTCVASGQVFPRLEINDVELFTFFVNMYNRSTEHYSNGVYDPACKGLVAFKWFTTADIWWVAGTFHYKDYRLFESVLQ